MNIQHACTTCNDLNKLNNIPRNNIPSSLTHFVILNANNRDFNNENAASSTNSLNTISGNSAIYSDQIWEVKL